MLPDSNRIHQTDKKFDADVSDDQFVNQLFIRLVAKGKRFTKVDFKYSIFDACYLRDCIFDSCDFTGCRFLERICMDRVLLDVSSIIPILKERKLTITSSIPNARVLIT